MPFANFLCPSRFARLAVLVLVAAVAAAQQQKLRVVITADPELDDNNTLIRAILYSSDFQIEGLVYASSTFHWKGDGKGTTQYIPGREYTRLGLCPCTSWRWSPNGHFIDDIVDAYAKVYANLKVHNPNYPSPAELKSKIKWGNVAFEGDYSKDTDGSNLIKSLLLDDQPGPLYVTAQGGQSTIARALKSIHDQYANTPQWEAIRDKVSLKLVVIPSGDQDGTYARYIKPDWPEVAERQLSTMDFGYFVRHGLAPEDRVYISAAWTQENIVSRGPLGALYRVWGDGKQMVKGDRTDYFGLSGYTADQLKKMGYMVWMPPQEKGSFLGEGDTPTNIVGPDYFSTFGIPLVRGRDFTSRDNSLAFPVAIVNEALARRYWPGKDPIGTRIRFGDGCDRGQGTVAEIVGVAKDAQYASAGTMIQPYIFYPFEQHFVGYIALVIRTRYAPATLASVLPKELRGVDSRLRIYAVDTLSGEMDKSLWQRRWEASLLSMFGALALMLASVGLYGVIAFAARQRMREFGIRIALGAQRRDVLHLVTGDALSMTLLGVGGGILISLALTNLFRSFLYGLSPADPATYTGAGLLWVAVSLIA